MQDAALAESPIGTLEQGLDAARTAISAGDLPTALNLYAALRDRFPVSPAPFLQAAFALMEAGRLDAADELLAAAIARFPDVVEVAVDRAWVAHRRRDVPDALLRWAHVRAAFPHHPIGYVGAAITLREAGQLDAAQPLLTDAETRFPDTPSVETELAWLAFAQRDFETAIRRWERVRDSQPDNVAGYTAGSAALREVGRFAEAEELMGIAVARHPELAEPAIEHARLAQRRDDRDAAAERWAQAHARFPDRPEPWVELAWLATRGDRLDDAAELWEQIRTRFPGNLAGYAGGAAAAAKVQRIDRAVALLNEAVQRFPNEPGPVLEQGWFVSNMGDSSAAEKIFTSVVQRWPDQPAGYLGLGRSLSAQGRHADTTTVLRFATAKFPNFALLAADLAALEKALAPAPPPAIVRTFPLRLIVAGSPLTSQIAQILRHLPPLRDRVLVETAGAALPAGGLDRADLYVEESRPGDTAPTQGVRALLPPSCAIRTFPASTMRALWPFGDGNADPIAASLAGTAMTDDALFDAYMELTETAALDLDALLSADLAACRADDAACDIQLASFIGAQFRDRCLFAAPTERDTPVVHEIVRQLLNTLAEFGAGDAATLHAALDRLLTGWRASKHALPIHPRVARHFQLRWWAPDLRYRMLGNEVTFRDYILRTIRRSPWLP